MGATAQGVLPGHCPFFQPLLERMTDSKTLESQKPSSLLQQKELADAVKNVAISVCHFTGNNNF